VCRENVWREDEKKKKAKLKEEEEEPFFRHSGI
jgi:hypothetical protein